MRNEITVVICNSYVLFREGIKAILQKQPTIHVVGEATTGRQVLEEVKSLKPNVVLMDLTLPDLSSVEVTRRIKEMSADTKILLLTMYEDETLIKRCLNAGASD